MVTFIRMLKCICAYMNTYLLVCTGRDRQTHRQTGKQIDTKPVLEFLPCFLIRY